MADNMHFCGVFTNIFIKVITSLFFVLSIYRLHGQEMTLYVIPPKTPMNWHSPQSLFFSYVDNLLARSRYILRSHPMGHLVIELKDSTRQTTVGIVAESKSDLAYKVYAKGYGLGILFTGLSGNMEEGEINTRELSKRARRGDVAFIKFNLCSDAFDRLWRYLEEYKMRSYHKIYNGENKPREGKGAGCTAFGTSFIDIAGLRSAVETDKWIVRANVPDKLIGGPVGNNRWVGIHRIMFKRKWADTTRQPYRKIVYHEPSLIYGWIAGEWATKGPVTAHGYKRAQKGKAMGLEIDCSQYTVPDEPIWQDNDTTRIWQPVLKPQT